jgi:hypothetical protein
VSCIGANEEKQTGTSERGPSNERTRRAGGGTSTVGREEGTLEHRTSITVFANRIGDTQEPRSSPLILAMVTVLHNPEETRRITARPIA